MSKRGTGRLYCKAGIWCLQIYDLHGQRRTFSLRTRDRAEARDRQQELVSRYRGDASVSERHQGALGQFFDEYWRQASDLKRPRTLAREESVALRFFNRARILRLSDLEFRHVQDYITFRRDGGVSPQSINLEVQVIRHFVRCGRKRGFPIHDPFADYKLLPVQKRQPRFLNLDQARHLLKTAEASRNLFPVVATGLFAGLRKGELLSLEWQVSPSRIARFSCAANPAS